MRFPRNAKVICRPLEAGAFAGVFFLLVIFLLLGQLIYTPGVRLQLPAGDDLPGTDQRTIAVALDSSGQLFFENQWIETAALKARLAEAVQGAGGPLTLVIRADKAVRYELLTQLTLMAREAGIREALLATMPRTFDAPAPKP